MAQKYSLIQSTRLNGVRYNVGQESDLLKVATKEQVSDLIGRKILSEVADVGASLESQLLESQSQKVSETAEAEALRSQLEESKTQLEESQSSLKTAEIAKTDLSTQLATARQIFETGKAENQRQHDELVALRPLKAENTALKTKVTKAENELEKLKAKAPATVVKFEIDPVDIPSTESAPAT